MLIIIKHDLITAGTKRFLEHISHCLPKATGGTGNSPGEKKCFKTGFAENQLAITGGFHLQPRHPKVGPWRWGVGGMGTC